MSANVKQLVSRTRHLHRLINLEEVAPALRQRLSPIGSGIWAVELAPDGLSVKEGAKPVQISAIDTEGAYVVKRGRWYYVFASRGSCCNGARSTYHVVVARSRHLLGPYTDPSGKSFLDHDYQYTILSSSAPDATFRGTGHNSELIRDDAIYMVTTKVENMIKAFPDYNTVVSEESVTNGFKWLYGTIEDEELPVATELFRGCFNELEK